MSSGRAGIEVTVSDGQQTGTGMVYFSVKPANTLAAVIDPAVKQTTPDTRTTIALKQYVHGTSAEPAQLTAVMPEGIRVTDCYENAMKPAELKWMRVNGTWEYDTADTETVAAKCRELFSAPVEVMRKTKRGEGLFTVTEHVRDLTFTAGDGIVTVEGIVSCAEPVVNPELLTAAVRTHLPDCAPDGGRFCRTALYRADGTPYR